MEGHTPHALEYFPLFVSSGNYLIHYTCNSPSLEILNKNNIKTRGNQFGCKDDREVLEIPAELYVNSFGTIKDKNTVNINLEKMMRDLR